MVHRSPRPRRLRGACEGEAGAWTAGDRERGHRRVVSHMQKKGGLRACSRSDRECVSRIPPGKRRSSTGCLLWFATSTSYNVAGYGRQAEEEDLLKVPESVLPTETLQLTAKGQVRLLI